MAIRQFLDGIEHHFEKGGRHERWYALYEAVDTISTRPVRSPNPPLTCVMALT